MKSIRNILIGVIIIGSLAASLSLLHAQTTIVGSFNSNLSLVQAAAPDSIVQVVADSQNLSLVSPGQAPRTGTFWWILPSGTAVPTPCPPQNDLTAPIYLLADGQFLVDQTGGQIPAIPRRFGMQAQTTSGAAISGLDMEADTVMNLILRAQTTAANAQMGMISRAMGMNSGPPGFGDTGDGGDGTNDFYSDSFNYKVPTNGLWLEITNVSNYYAWLNLHNATNRVYEILSKTDLSAASWNIETELWPTDTNCMPFTIPVRDRTNALFVWAQDWTGVTENGNTTPDWWFYYYFGTVNLSDTNLDGGGFYTHTLLDDYNSQTDPNIIQFSIGVANNYVNTSHPNLQLNILAGTPYYYAMLVDSTNFTGTNWTTYTSPTVMANLGGVQGWHDIWIGLRGLPQDASQTWQHKRLKLDSTAPLLVITNPTAGTVSVPMIQLQGYCAKALASISYDLSNAVGVVTGQQAFVTGQSTSISTWEFTTNYFECVDVPLTNGLNVITLHATDLAGNVSALVTSYTVDYSNKAPPTIQLDWPQDGMVFCGSQIVCRGRISDPTATITATMVDTNNTTNTLNGLVGRDGNFAFDNVPLAGGANRLNLTVSDVANNVVETNLTILQGNAGLTIDPVAAGQTTITGTINSINFTVWVNGEQAAVSTTVNDNGVYTWEADNVPTTPNGLVKVTAVPNGGGQ